MDFAHAPLWIQVVLIILGIIAALTIWSIWELILDKARQSGKETVERIMGERSKSESIDGLIPRLINKTFGLIIFLSVVFLFQETTASRIFKVIGYAGTLIGVLIFLKKILKKRANA